MLKISRISKVYLTFEELMNLEVIDINRCGEFEKEKALEKGFTEAEWETFKKRGMKLRKLIRKEGFSRASSFVIARGTDGKLYILDGQGRRMAVYLMSVLDGMDFSEFQFMADYYEEPMSKEEMGEIIKTLNTGATNWKTQDKRRSDAISSNNPKVIEAFKYSLYLQDKYDLNSYNVNLFLYGSKASHQVSDSLTLSTDNYLPTKDIFFQLYTHVIETLSYKVDKDGNQVERSKSVCKKIRIANFATTFEGCLRKIYRHYKGNIAEAQSDLEYFTEKVIDAFNGNCDEYVTGNMKCISTDMGSLLKIVSPKLKRKSVKEIFQLSNKLFKEVA